MSSWDAILRAVGNASSGRSDEACAALRACWERTRPSDHAQRCVLAHYLADQQSDLATETEWDERALSEHGHVSDADLAPVGVPSAAGFAPSLHLNLGDDYLRAGNLESARRHLRAARAVQDVLPEQGYGALIRSGLDRLAARLGEPR